MPSEVERIAGRLRFLSDQAQQHRSPVLEASQKLREAAGAVATLRFEQPEGPPILPPAHLAAYLNQAAERARGAVAPLTQTAELLRVFAARLAAGGGSSGGSGGGTGRSAPSNVPAGNPPSTGVPRSGDRPGPDELPSPDVRSASAERGAREGPQSMPSGTGSVGLSRYGRYPITTAVRLSPGNRS